MQIQNASPRGLLLLAPAEAPAPGAYVEVRRDTVVIVARAVWRSGRRFGVRAQDRIDLKRLIAPRTARPIDAPAPPERRRAPRPDLAATSGRQGRALQFAFVLAATGLGATAVIASITTALAPIRNAGSYLIGG